MTDRVSGLVVTLAEDTREDDVAPLIQAILMMRGVVDVSPVVVDVRDYISRKRILIKIRNDLLAEIDRLTNSAQERIESRRFLS